MSLLLQSMTPRKTSALVVAACATAGLVATLAYMSVRTPPKPSDAQAPRPETMQTLGVMYPGGGQMR